MQNLFKVDKAIELLPQGHRLRKLLSIAQDHEYVFDILQEDEGLKWWDFGDYKYSNSESPGVQKGQDKPREFHYFT